MTEPYVTLDGSLIRELVRPQSGGATHLSLAEATIQPGQTTHRHLHRRAEEVYYVLSGTGVVQVAARTIPVRAGAAVVIPPGAEHCAMAVGKTPLRLLCACSPPYQHDDTKLCEPPVA